MLWLFPYWWSIVNQLIDQQLRAGYWLLMLWSIKYLFCILATVAPCGGVPTAAVISWLQEALVQLICCFACGTNRPEDVTSVTGKVFDILQINQSTVHRLMDAKCSDMWHFVPHVWWMKMRMEYCTSASSVPTVPSSDLEPPPVNAQSATLTLKQTCLLK